VGGNQGRQLGQGGRGAVHLPIASGEFFHGGLVLFEAGLAKSGAFEKPQKALQAAG
jgi:hypothetical protein